MHDMNTLQSDPPRLEYLRRRAHAKVSPRTAHGIVQGALGSIMRACAGERGVVGPEIRCYPGDMPKRHTSLVPDVSFLSRGRLLALPDAERREKPPFSPDVAVEVRSPSDDLRFLREKIALYLSTGSALVLDVDPHERVIHAHAQDGVTVFRSGMMFHHLAAPWLRFAVDDVFREVDLLHS